jgi:DNA-binding MarR family transcriptional regulator
MKKEVKTIKPKQLDTNKKLISKGKQKLATPEYLELNLENALPFLLARAGMKMGLSFVKEIKPFDLSLIEWRVCAALHHESQQRLSDVAYHTSSDPSTLSRTVDGLIKRGLVKRERSDIDARALELSLTPLGLEFTEKIIPFAHLYEKVALAGFSEDEATLLREMLKKIYENMSSLDHGKTIS